MDIVSTMGKVAGCRPQPQRAGEGASPARRTGEHGAPERRPQGEERAGRRARSPRNGTAWRRPRSGRGDAGSQV